MTPTPTDPADRLRRVREHIARERLRLPVVDADGFVVERPAPVVHPDAEADAGTVPGADLMQGNRGGPAVVVEATPLSFSEKNRALAYANRHDIEYVKAVETLYGERR